VSKNGLSNMLFRSVSLIDVGGTWRGRGPTGLTEASIKGWIITESWVQLF
jgi:hypothetical protein